MKSALFLFYVFIEVMITVPLASAIGVLYTFLEIVLSAFLGFAILFNTPFTIKENLGNIMQ
ncbi:MAG: FxsA family protein, partial [Campylobacteraceae bacterium]|nr:FxsA family protein [Campylobacteraceae bacterium]